MVWCRVGLTLALLAGCAGPTPSVHVARSAPTPGVVFISDVAVVDVAKGERIPARDVLIANGRITAISRAGSSAAPAGATVVPGRDATLVPGLVDMHGHVYADTHPVWALGIPDAEANLRAYLYAGVTTVSD